MNRAQTLWWEHVYHTVDSGETRFMGVISDITSVIGLVKKAKQLADELKNLELKEVIVDLQGKLLDVKEEIVKLREENANLTEQVKRASAPPDVTLKDGMYYRGDDGPFCMACHGGKGKLIRLIDANDPEQRLLHIRHKCPICKATYIH
jgi:hypothetical protein